MTIHSLAGRLVHAMTRRTHDAKNGDDQDLFAIMNDSQSIVVERARQKLAHFKRVDDLLKRCGRFAKIREIIVDEAQDISRSQYGLVMELKRLTGCVVCMVGDVNQSIYAFQGGSDDYMMSHPGMRMQLRTNHRSTHEIVSFCNQLAISKAWQPMHALPHRHGPKPTWVVAQHVDGVLEYIHRECCTSNDVVILAPCKVGSDFAANTTVGLSTIKSYLDARHVPNVMHYDVCQGDISTSDLHSSMDRSKVNIMTIHGSKGLEFDTVLLVDFHHKTMKSMPQHQERKDHACLWYVGCSRAIRKLVVFTVVGATNRNLPYIGIRDCSEGTYDMHLVGDAVLPPWPADSSLYKDADACKRWVTPTQILHDRVFLPEEGLLSLCSSMKCKLVKATRLWEPLDCANIDSRVFSMASALPGIVAHLVLELAAINAGCTNGPVSIVKSIEHELQNTIIISKPMYASWCSLLGRLGGIEFSRGEATLASLKRFENDFSRGERQVFDHLVSLNTPFDTPLRPRVNDHHRAWFDASIIEDLCAMARSQDTCRAISAIVSLALYRLQTDAMAAFLWVNKSVILEKLSPILSNLYDRAYTKLQNKYSSKQLSFESRLEHPNLSFVARADVIIDDVRVVELKFKASLEPDTNDILQTALTAINAISVCNNSTLSPSNAWPMQFEVWNIRHGLRRVYQMDMPAARALVALSKAVGSRMQRVVLVHDTTSNVFIEPFLNLVLNECRDHNTLVRFGKACNQPVLLTESNEYHQDPVVVKVFKVLSPRQLLQSIFLWEEGRDIGHLFMEVIGKEPSHTIMDMVHLIRKAGKFACFV